MGCAVVLSTELDGMLALMLPTESKKKEKKSSQITFS